MSWKIKEEKVNDYVNISLIDIDKIDGELKCIIDNLVVKICEGDSLMNSSLEEIKRFLLGTLNKTSKKDSNITMGAIAEFFIHVYLNIKGYRQECFFINLEEPNSIKKGFDGFYSLMEKEWIMESKSGYSSTARISHKSKVKEAYSDLQDKFSVNVKNDPWKNAFMHSSNVAISTNLSIQQRIIKYSKDFQNNIGQDLKLFNIIPCSTIFVVDEWEDIEVEKILINLTESIMKFNYREILVVCITQKSLTQFIDYLKE